jgi:allantoinase
MIRKIRSSNKCDSFLIWAGKVAFGVNSNNYCKTSIVTEGSLVVGCDGRIESCHARQTEGEARAMASAKNVKLVNMGSGAVLSPGLIDVHCHISELGRDWEGYRSATRAAAAGGITTLMGMPLNSLPATTSKRAFEMEVEAANNTALLSDVGLWGGVVSDSMDNVDEILSCGVFGIKAFLAPLPEAAGYQAVSPSVLAQVAAKCGEKGIPLLVHSELMTRDEVSEFTDDAYLHHKHQPSSAHLASRPRKWERDAIQVVCDLADTCSMHIVHLSDSGSLDIIQSTKRRPEARLTVETCPHYLLMAVESHGTVLTKCFPPIRDEENRQRLWQDGINAGLIDMIASDHSPCSAALRDKPFKEAWAGISGLQYQLQATLTSMNSMGFTEDQQIFNIAKLWSKEPAKLIPGFRTVKGKLEPGMQADLCVWDPTYFGIPPAEERHRWRGDSPYSQTNLKGRILATFLNGVQVYDGETDSLLHDGAKAPGSMWVRETSRPS